MFAGLSAMSGSFCTRCECNLCTMAAVSRWETVAALQQQLLQVRKQLGELQSQQLQRHRKESAVKTVMFAQVGTQEVREGFWQDSCSDDMKPQKASEEFVKETNTSIAAKSEDIIDKSDTTANKDFEHMQRKEMKEATSTSSVLFAMSSPFKKVPGNLPPKCPGAKRNASYSNMLIL